MQKQSPQTEETKAPLQSASSSSSVDIRCAVALAKIALQTLADLNPEAAAAIDHALAFEIETTRLNKDADALAVIAILTDVRARLSGDEPRPVSDDGVWYIE